MGFFQDLARTKLDKLRDQMRKGRYGFIKAHGYKLKPLKNYSDNDLKQMTLQVYKDQYKLSEDAAREIVYGKDRY